MTPTSAATIEPNVRRGRLLTAVSGVIGGLATAVCFAVLWSIEDPGDDPVADFLILSVILYLPVALLAWAPIGAWLLGPRARTGTDRSLLRLGLMMGGCLGAGVGAALWVGLAALAAGSNDIGPAVASAVGSGLLGGVVAGLTVILVRRPLLGTPLSADDPSAPIETGPTVRRLAVGTIIAFVVALVGAGLAFLWLLAHVDLNMM